MNISLHNNIKTLYAIGFFQSFIVVIPVEGLAPTGDNLANRW